VVPLEEQGEWYRYHYLFSELLLYELRSSRPELVPVWRGRASVWLEDAAFFDEAIRHALVAEDYERGIMLIVRHWLGYVLAGQMATVEGWLESLPEEMIIHDAPLALVRAWICILSGRIEESARFLTLAKSIPYEGPLPDETASVEAGVAILRAVFGLGGVRNTLEAARRAGAP
jgi:LuxR family maltose regulon positive regulatory protein